MHLPAKIKAGGITYDILHEKNVLDERSAYGITNHDKQYIQLDPDMKPDRLGEVVLHELLHVAFQITALHNYQDFKEFTEEDLVDGISRALYTLIVDNKLDFNAS